MKKEKDMSNIDNYMHKKKIIKKKNIKIMKKLKKKKKKIKQIEKKMQKKTLKAYLIGKPKERKKLNKNKKRKMVWMKINLIINRK